MTPARRWAPAVRHLQKVDPHFKPIIDRIGPCLLEPQSYRFDLLVRSIISQQISSKAADSINQRLRDLSGGDLAHEPERLIALGEGPLRTAGLSGVKARYVLNLAEAVIGGTVPIDAIDDTWADEDVVKSLTTVKGIGVWTAEMFLIFGLARPDVLPVGDLGVRAAIRKKHGLAELPSPQECRNLAEPWRPYRTIAVWYLWRNTDTAAVAGSKPKPKPESDPKTKSKPVPIPTPRS